MNTRNGQVESGGVNSQFRVQQDTVQESEVSEKLRSLKQNNSPNESDINSDDSQQQPSANRAKPRNQRTSEQQSDSNDRPKRNPYCSRCRNHGKNAQVKGHKRHCEYKNCRCEGCELVEFRQFVSAAQIKRRRYQKQDEEYGRVIEVSPPVFRRKEDGEPPAIITKAILSNSAKHSSSIKQSSTEIQTRQLAEAVLLPPAHQATPSQPASQTRAMDTEVIVPVVAAAVPTSLLSQQQLSHSHPHSHPHLAALNTQHYLNLSHQHNLQQQHQHHHHQLQHQHLNHLCSDSIKEAQAVDQLAANTAAYNNATLHLLSYPGSILSHAAAAAASASIIPSSVSGHQPSTPTQTNSSTSLTKNTDQSEETSRDILSKSKSAVESELMSQIEQIQAYGRLAIYAWLRAEKFDLNKVCDIIEFSRPSFENLTDSKSHSPPNNNNNNNNSSASNNNNRSNNSSNQIDKDTTNTNSNQADRQTKTSRTSTASCCGSIESLSSGSRNSSPKDLDTSRASVNSINANQLMQNHLLHQHLQQQPLQQHQVHHQPTADHDQTRPDNIATIGPSSSSPVTTIGLKSTGTSVLSGPIKSSTDLSLSSGHSISSSPLLHNNHMANGYCNNGFINGLNGNPSAAAAAAAAAAATHYNMPLPPPTLNSLPTSAAQSLLWSGFKLTTSGVGGNTVIHPHHNPFLNPFIHHPLNYQ